LRDYDDSITIIEESSAFGVGKYRVDTPSRAENIAAK